MKLNKYWFTLIEILIWILIFNFVIIGWFQALSAVNIWKIKLIEKTNITKDAYYFSERLFEEIKSWWILDFEEYFNRKIVWTTTSSWYYSIPTWFWNFGSWWSIWNTNYWDDFYYCENITLWNWCFTSWDFQRYWQYAFQFIDYDSNWNWWDENWDWNIRWDDDDEHLWLWPIVFTWWQNVREIYLISWDRKKRTLFRWSWKEDEFPYKPTSATCNWTTFWSGCLWTIEILKLEWKDWWFDHSNSSWTWYLDWIIDTWIIDPKFSWENNTIAWSNSDNYRQPIFSDNISVSNFEIFAYPNIDRNHAWKDIWASININPYIRINMTLTPSWKKRVGMKWKIPELKLSTTINLVDYFTK